MTILQVSAADSQANPTQSNDPAGYEQNNVHNIYDRIAPHFSRTRYKPWPVVDAFLVRQWPGSVGIDVGCGNGKNLGVNPDVFLVGSDRSLPLVKIAAQHYHQHGRFAAVAGTKAHTGSNGDQKTNDNLPRDTALDSSKAAAVVIVADSRSLPHPDHTFDFAICIAVIHHLSTRKRRVDSIREILRTLWRKEGKKSGRGQALLFVWALEQESSRRGWSAGDEQDQLVPWVLKSESSVRKQGKIKIKRARPEGQRREAKAKSEAAPDRDEPSSVSGSRVAERPEQEPQTDNGDAVSGNGGEKAAADEEQTFHRFYHLYAEGELEKECDEAGAVVVESGYDRDNWWVVVEPREAQ